MLQRHLKAVIEYGFQKLSFHKIIIAHAEKNIKSKRICEKLGFTQYAHEQDAFRRMENGITCCGMNELIGEK